MPRRTTRRRTLVDVVNSATNVSRTPGVARMARNRIRQNYTSRGYVPVKLMISRDRRSARRITNGETETTRYRSSAVRGDANTRIGTRSTRVGDRMIAGLWRAKDRRTMRRLRGT